LPFGAPTQYARAMHPLMADALARDRAPKPLKKVPVSGVAAALAQTRLFALCSKKDLRTVASAAKVHRYPQGTRLMEEGAPGESMYVILSGHVRVSRGGRKVATLGAGDAVGELAVISRCPRNATVDADESVEVAEINRRSLAKLINDVPSFAQKLLESMAARVRELDKKDV